MKTRFYLDGKEISESVANAIQALNKEYMASGDFELMAKCQFIFTKTEEEPNQEQEVQYSMILKIENVKCLYKKEFSSLEECELFLNQFSLSTIQTVSIFQGDDEILSFRNGGIDLLKPYKIQQKIIIQK